MRYNYIQSTHWYVDQWVQGTFFDRIQTACWREGSRGKLCMSILVLRQISEYSFKRDLQSKRFIGIEKSLKILFRLDERLTRYTITPSPVVTISDRFKIVFTYVDEYWTRILMSAATFTHSFCSGRVFMCPIVFIYIRLLENK